MFFTSGPTDIQIKSRLIDAIISNMKYNMTVFIAYLGKMFILMAWTSDDQWKMLHKSLHSFE